MLAVPQDRQTNYMYFFQFFIFIFLQNICFSAILHTVEVMSANLIFSHTKVAQSSRATQCNIYRMSLPRIADVSFSMVFDGFREFSKCFDSFQRFLMVFESFRMFFNVFGNFLRVFSWRLNVFDDVLYAGMFFRGV